MREDPLSELPEWTQEERLLLTSAEVDRPPPSSLGRTLKAASLTSAVAGSVTATHAAASTLGGKATVGAVLGKWLLFATCVGGAAVGAQAWRDHTAGRAVVTQVPESAPAIVVAPRPTREPAVEPAAPRTDEPSDSAPSTAPPRNVSAPAPSAVTQPDLTRDIAALDRARQALRAGHASEALAALERYDVEFGKAGALRVEAGVLRIEATARSGNRARAQQLARAFLARDGKSPYAARVRAILEP